jgi:hypothetical protein
MGKRITLRPDFRRIAMGTIRRIMTWLSGSRHKKTNAFLGGGLVIVVAAA